MLNRSKRNARYLAACEEDYDSLVFDTLQVALDQSFIFL